MKHIAKFALFFVLIFAANQIGLAQTVIFSDDFESSGGWTLTGEFEIASPAGMGGDYGNPDPNTAYSGTSVLGTDLTGAGAYTGDYEVNLGDRAYVAVSPVFDCSTYDKVELSFQRWLNVEGDAYDNAYIEVTNNGITWNVIWENDATTITDNSWTKYIYDISAFAAGQSNVQIRFSIGTTDGGWQYSGWNIDDLEITGIAEPINFGNSPGLVYWLQAGYGTTGATPVSSWDDLSGNGNNAVQDPNGPNLVTSTGLNISKVLAFSGAEELNIADNWRINGGGGYIGDQRSMFVAFRTSADINTTQYIYEEGGGTNGLSIFIKNGNIYTNIFNNSGADRITNFEAISANTDYIVSLVWNAGTFEAKLNNVAFSNQTAAGSMTTLSSHTGDISIGFTDGTIVDENSGVQGGGANFSGELAEIIYYDEALSSADVNQVYTQMATRYGIISDSDSDIYYSYQSGNWNSSSSWTHDPGGTTQNATDIPKSGDIVIILDARNIALTADVDTTNLDITINAGGILDLGDHSFTAGLSALRGEGTLKLSSTNFPTVTTNEFVQQGGGTTEFYNTVNFTLPATQAEYNHLTINTVDKTATQLSNLTLNGNLYVKTGTYQINDNSATRRQLTINGDVLVDAGATISVGTGNTTNADFTGGTAPFTDYYDKQTHRVIIKGNLMNKGTVRFTNQSYPVYNAFPTNGAATVYFTGESDTDLRCEGTTDFYNLVLDKGIDQSFSLTIYSSQYKNFRLFGRNDLAGEGGTSNPNLRKALWIRTGTLVLQGLTIIPSLTEADATGSPNGDFYIPENGALLIDGSEVIVFSTADDYREVNLAYNVSAPNNASMGIRTANGTQALSVYGKIEINRGYLSTRESSGILTWQISSGQIIINGGTVDAKQFRSGDSGGSGIVLYDQSGGQFLLRGRFQRTPVNYTNITSLKDFSETTLNTNRLQNGTDGSYGTFSLSSSENVFSFAGGTISVYDACGAAGTVFEVLSSDANINSSGGTIELKPVSGSGIADNATHFVESNAALNNFTINRISGSTNIELNTYPLTVLNDLRIETGSLNAAGYDVSVAGDFTISAAGTYISGNNWTIFNGQSGQRFAINVPAALGIKKLKIDKPASSELIIEGSQTNITIQDSLIINTGTLNDGGKTITMIPSTTTTSSYIYNSGTYTGTGKLELADDDPQLITGDGNGVFENLELNNTDASGAPISLGANMFISGTLTFSQDNIFDINTNTLHFGESASTVNVSAARFVQTAGNAGDGGIVKDYSSSAQAFIFPVGAPSTRHANAEYTPASIEFNSAPDVYGSIRVIPVGYEHPNTTIKNRSLTYFWRVKSEGFTLGTATITQAYQYSTNDVVSGGDIDEAGYVFANYNRNTLSWTKGVITDVDEATNNIGGAGTILENVNYIDGEFTAGDDNTSDPFGAPTIYYSRRSGLWGNVATWSLTDHTTNDNPLTPPGAGDIVIIGGQDSVYLATNNTVPNTDIQNAATLKIEAGSALDIGYNPGCNFGIVLSHENGNGNFRLTTSRNSGATFAFPLGDFSDFNINVGTTELYTTNPTAGTTYWLPNGVTQYGNLIISPLGGSNIIFPNNDLLLYGDLVMRGQDSRSWFCPNWRTQNYPTAPAVPVSKTITVKGDFKLEGGALVWYNRNNTGPQDFVVHGDLILDTNTGIQVYTTGSNNSQAISVAGSLINNSLAPGGGANGYRGADFDEIPLTFFGDGTSYITSDDITVNTYTNIETLTVNKGTSQNDSLIINIGGNLSTPTNNWLTLLNGTLKYSRVNPGADFTITTTNSFTIPTTAGLYVDYPQNATNRNILLANASSNDNDLYLDGKLTVKNGNVYVGPTNGTTTSNNDIEYAGGGKSTIDISGGQLIVNGQIRRNPATSNGVLKYYQTGGDVVINGQNATTANAKLEVLNPGSVFNMSSGTLTIVRGGGANFGDLYLRPESSSVTGGEIIFTQSPAIGPVADQVQSYIIDANIPLNDLTISGKTAGTSRLAQVNVLISPLVLNGDLSISNAQSILDMNTNYNINLTVNGQFTNNGLYAHYDNTTYFNGNVQTISGTSATDFYNLEVNPITSLSLSKDINVENDLVLLSGQLLYSTFNVNVYGNVVNNANYDGDAVQGGLVLRGSSKQLVSGTGTFGRLELNNISGARTLNEISLQKNFRLSNGIFDINDNLLNLGQNSEIEGSGFGENKMIISDGVYSNVGIRKYFSIYSGPEQTFVFPIGTSGKYTPATLKYTDNTNVGYIRVNNINDNHPGVWDDNNVLNYYWELESSGIQGFNGSVDFAYYDTDVKVNGANTEADYVAAALLVPGSSWLKSSPGAGTDNVDETNNIIQFTYSASNSLSGEYTCGIETALPDNVPEFTSNTANGDWSDPANWTQTSGDPHVLTGGPNGFIVVIRDTDEIRIDGNYTSAYRTEINGRLVIDPTSYGHNLGSVSGSGTLYLENGTLPAGRYDDFFDCISNSTLEYGGSTNYNLIADLYDQVSHLVFTGSGNRVLPNKNLTICDQLVIDGPTLDNSLNNRTLIVNGSMERYNSGAFVSGTGASATVVLSGTSQQSIGGSLGDFTGANAFNNLQINNSQGLNVNTNGNIEIAGNLLLTNGIIHTVDANSFFLSNSIENCVFPAGGSANSYINGAMTKRINQGDDFKFPVGKDDVLGNKLTLESSQTGTIDWTVEFNSPNPGFANFAAPLTYVNYREYWTITAPAGSAAYVSLEWDPSSDITPLMTQNGISDMRVAYDNSGTWTELTSVGSGNNNNGSVTTSSRLTISASGSWDVTTACINVIKPRARLNPSGPVCGAAGIPVTFTGSALVSDYILTYEKGGVLQAPVTITSADLPYNLPTDAAGTTYQLISFTYNNPASPTAGVVDPEIVTSYTLPTTAAAGPDQSICGGTSVTLAANTPTVGTGLWTITNGTGGTVVTPTDPASTFNGTNGSGYTLRWTITNGGCTSSDEMEVAFPLLPEQPQFFTQSSNLVCQGVDGVVYEVPDDASVTYNWSYSGTGHTIVGADHSITIDFDENATSGTVSVSTTNGCGTSAPQVVNVTVNDMPKLVMTVVAALDSICDTETSQIEIDFTQGAAPFDFTLSDGTNNYNISTSDDPYVYTTAPLNWAGPNAYNDYSYTISIVTDDNGCSNTTTGANGVVRVFKIPETGPQYHIQNN